MKTSIGKLMKLFQKKPNGRFDEPQSAKYIKQMASALSYCHQKKVSSYLNLVSLLPVALLKETIPRK
jgi:serine/threonine protein kinase